MDVAVVAVVAESVAVVDVGSVLVAVSVSVSGVDGSVVVVDAIPAILLQICSSLAATPEGVGCAFAGCDFETTVVYKYVRW